MHDNEFPKDPILHVLRDIRTRDNKIDNLLMEFLAWFEEQAEEVEKGRPLDRARLRDRVETLAGEIKSLVAFLAKIQSVNAVVNRAAREIAKESLMGTEGLAEEKANGK